MLSLHANVECWHDFVTPQMTEMLTCWDELPTSQAKTFPLLMKWQCDKSQHFDMVFNMMAQKLRWGDV